MCWAKMGGAAPGRPSLCRGSAGQACGGTQQPEGLGVEEAWKVEGVPLGRVSVYSVSSARTYILFCKWEPVVNLLPTTFFKSSKIT